MKSLRAIAHLARADFLERSRRHAFLMTLAFTLFVAYSAVTGDITLRLDDWRGVYNSAWIGGLMTMVATSFLTLAGFYLVKNAIERDRDTGVGQILAATSMSKPVYTLGKFLSNALVLSSMVLVLALGSIVMQPLAGEDTHLDLWALLAPLILVALPALVFVGAVAVLFESIPGLRGGLGNVVYFFLWGAAIAAPSAIVFDAHKDAVWFDLPGYGTIGSQIMAAGREHIPNYKGGFSLTIASGKAHHAFRWDGIRWTEALIRTRLLWLVAAGVVALLAALPFDRFDRTRSSSPARGRRGAGSRGFSGIGTSLGALLARPGPAGLVRAELLLLVREMPAAWLLVAIGLVIAGFVTPLPAARAVVLPFAWIWPLLIWSGMGNREARHGAEALVFSAPRVLRRQLPATWLAGVIVAVALGSGVAVPLVASGDLAGALAWLAGALFIPALALALGVWSGSGKLFEVLFLLAWYIGPLHRVTALDFIGVEPATVAAGTPVVVAVATVALLAVAFAGRWRQIRG